jgi:hypothetical protein
LQAFYLLRILCVLSGFIYYLLVLIQQCYYPFPINFNNFAYLPSTSGGDLAAISLVPLDQFRRFLARFIGLVETFLSSPQPPETVRSLFRHRRRRCRRHSDLSRTRFSTVPLDFMLNGKLLSIPFYRPHIRVAASARSRDIRIFRQYSS